MATTVGDLHARGVRVRWRCDVSGHHGDLDLARLIEARGPNVDLAHKRPPCRVAGCPGVVSFSHLLLGWPTAIDHLTDQDEGWWAFNDQRRAALKALGYRMVSGAWVAPETTKPPPPVRATGEVGQSTRN